MAPKKRHDTHHGAASKRQKVATPVDYATFYQSTIDAIADLRDESSGRDLTEAFQKLPPKKLYPDYYTIVKNPISIAEILKKASKGVYESDDPQEFVQDFQLLLDNARTYNDPDSWIVGDARQIYDFVVEQVDHYSEKSNEGVTFESLPHLTSEILQDVIDHEFPEIGVISGPFLDVVDRKEYPDYFKVITHPTSFNKILGDIKKNKLFDPSLSLSENLQLFYDQTSLIFKNAQTYNDPLSLIHQDANSLKDLFERKYNELKAKVDSEEHKNGHTKLTLKLKPPTKKEPLPKVKISLKAKEPEQEQVPKKRGRKKKSETIVKEEEPIVDNSEDEMEDSNVGDDSLVSPDANDTTGPESPKQEVKQEPLSQRNLPLTQRNEMGKTKKVLPTNEVFIQDILISSPITNVSQVLQQSQSKTLGSIHHYAYNLKQALIPSLPASTAFSLFESKIACNGYSSQSYSLSLPPDTNSFVTVKIGLHPIIHELKNHELVAGQAFYSLSESEDFQFKLLVNDDEVTNGGEVFEADSKDSLIVQYDVKLSHGLNVLAFEMKIAPSLSKLIRKGIDFESEETSGRHTRHQIQQLKLNWEIERFNLFVISNCA